VIDVAHELPRHAIAPAALVLRNALAFMPTGVHMAVVDPGVGTDRRSVALACRDGNLLVGPDNGLLWLAAEQCGGIERAVDISRSPFGIEPVSATFHGRDLFAPVVARLATGTPVERTGEEIDPDSLVRLELPRPEVEAGQVTAAVISLDRFGNAQLNVDADQLDRAGIKRGDRVVIECGGRGHDGVVFGRTFADVEPGGMLIYEDSAQAIAIAVNRGDAAATLGLSLDSEVTLTKAGTVQ
jgi:S-adenosylmethionine hydrolase